MRFKLLLVCFLSITFSWVLNGQDIHYSYYNFTPMLYNPANAGAFSGSFRVSGILARKDAGIAQNPFQTFSLSADAPLIRGIRKQDWIGIGFHIDVLGRSGTILTDPPADNTNFLDIKNYKIALAYHLALNKNQSDIVTLGFQYGSSTVNMPGLMPNNVSTRVHLQTNLLDLDVQQFQSFLGTGNTDNPSISYGDVVLGVLYNARRKKSDLRLGFSLEGIFAPRIGVSSRSTNTNNTIRSESKYFGLNIHGEYKMDLTDRTSVIPAFYLYNLGPATALNINTHVWYQFNPEKELKGGLGLGLRNTNDVILYAGLDFSAIRVGMAYDFNLNNRTIASSGLGGFELAVSYLGKIYKTPKVKPVIFCPRL